ncbi:hypothetical protein LEM8419_03571 [Neolewinella maritima]|uniref:Terminase small subunit n=1 Tax=Neolewinella maritima TaxID=1383882 RepID=A0ABN8FE29_9BACT|nr:terminase small subunit [Neolewinella maritima]CAH1002699.1 hypothetical protein LEM8419_03571 [Neolewinella maritima]
MIEQDGTTEEQAESKQLTLSELSERLTDKQRTFAKEYILDLNATQAAKRAGYSEKTAVDIGCENLKKPNITQYIDALRNDLFSATGITAAKVVMEHKKAAFTGMGQFLDGWDMEKDWNDLPEDAKDILSEVTVTRTVNEDGSRTVERVQMKRVSKTESLKEISKILGIYAPTKSENTVEASVNHTADIDLDEYLK